MIWFTSDQHYFHRNIIKYTNRPYSSVEEMNEALIKAHNSVVSIDDTVWFLGDFGFAGKKELGLVLNRLNGRKNIVYGNHDKGLKGLEGHFETCSNYKEISYSKQKICLFHYAARVWNGSHNGSWFLFGHSHGTLPSWGRSVDVGVDNQEITDEYRPVSFDELKKFMDKKEIKIVDHHKNS